MRDRRTENLARAVVVTVCWAASLGALVTTTEETVRLSTGGALGILTPALVDSWRVYIRSRKEGS